MKILKKLKEFFRVQFCHAKYKILLKKLRKEIKKRKLRVLFYVTENQKWGYQSLYELFEQSNIFEPIIVVGILTSVHNGKDKTRNNLEENYQFFKTRNMNVEYGYKNGDYVDLKTFKPDIIFYEQQWGLPKKYKPNKIANIALTCHINYGLAFFCNPNNYSSSFHQLLWTYFVDNPLNIKRYKEYNKQLKNCIYKGYPKLDVYLEEKDININKIWKNPNKFKVIYAPHHSFEDESLNLATFQKNGQFILNLAKSHPETTWIFKPHPRFKFAILKNNIMTEEEIENYYKEWENIGEIYTQGDYFDLFKTSDLLITDCASFLGEYLPTKKPIIRLINKKAKNFNDFGNFLIKICYNVENNKCLENIFQKFLQKENNINLTEKLKTIEAIIDYKKSSSIKIFDYIKEVLI